MQTLRIDHNRDLVRCIMLMTVAILFASCSGKKSATVDSNKPIATPTQQPPSATEVFHLRSECADLGEKILNESIIGSALTQSQVSHYNPKTNRCYVELTVMSADLTKREVYSSYLYDGQTGEMLAFVSIQRGDTSFAVFKKPGFLDYQEVCAYINEKMQDDEQ